jgi:hypothetical protein
MRRLPDSLNSVNDMVAMNANDVKSIKVYVDMPFYFSSDGYVGSLSRFTDAIARREKDTQLIVSDD